MKTWNVYVQGITGRWELWLTVRAPSVDAAALMVRDACPADRFRVLAARR